MNRTRVAVASAFVLCLASGGSSAQVAAPGSTATGPETVVPPTDLNGKPGTLSDKLSGTNGVIKPNGDVDPAMPKDAPQTGNTPVLKPGTVPGQSDKGGLY